MRSRRCVIAWLTAVVVVLPTGAVAQDLQGRLEDAERRVEGIQSDLADAAEAYEDTWATIETLRVEQAELTERAQRLEAELADAADALTRRAVVMFKRGQPSDSLFLLTAEGPAEAADRAALLAALQRRDLGRAEQAGALRTALDQTQALLADRAAQLDVLQARLDEQRDRLASELDRAETVAVDLRSRAARQRRIDRGVQSGTYACIFDRGRTNFRDTWGAPRSGGRRHKGTDVFAAMGQNVYAFTGGVIQRHSHSRLGGIGLYLRGSDGNVYYYAHLQRIDANGAVGRRVEAGELIAYNGDTGNARGGAPHVHFEIHPGGGAAINPYPWLAAACF